MNDNTIPAQLGPLTVPATLGLADASGHDPAATPRVGPAIKWLIGAVAAALLVYLAR